MASAEEAVRVCACHGVPQAWNKDARRKAGGYWRCFVKKRESPQYPANKTRYERGRIRVIFAGVHYTYRVDPERKASLQAELAAFRARQRDQEVPVGRLDEAVPRA